MTACQHNFIRITQSSYRDAPYLFCSKCGEHRELASADTHPKGGDVEQAPLVSGAVPHEDEADAQRHD